MRRKRKKSLENSFEQRANQLIVSQIESSKMKKIPVMLLRLVVSLIFSISAIGASLEYEERSSTGWMVFALCIGIFSATIAVINLYQFFSLIGAGTYIRAKWYLSDGQIVTVRGAIEWSEKYYCEDTFHLLVEIKPGKYRYLVVDQKHCDDDEVKVGYLYRYLNGKFQKVPVGSGSDK